MNVFVSLLIAAQALTHEERQTIDYWLFWIQSGLVAVVVTLIVLAISLRVIAKRSTHPCRWCMEFISKKAAVCPRCGKACKERKAEA